MEFITESTVDMCLHSRVFAALRRTGAAGAAVCVTKLGGKAASFSMTRAYGYSCADEHEPVSVEDTWFDMGALARLLAMLTTLTLLDEKGLSLDARVATLLPEGVEVDCRDWRPLTLQHLLTHTSGLQCRGSVARNSGGSSHPSGGGVGGGVGDLSKGALHDARLGATVPLQQRLARSAGCSTSVVHHFLSSCELACDAAPGSVYRPSEVDVMLMAAVAESLGGGQPYPVLARQRVLAPLGIRLGRARDVSCYNTAGMWHPPGASDESGEQGLSPLDGLVLTPEGASRLLGALLPGLAADGANPGAKPGASGAAQPRAVVSAQLLSKLTEVHFTDKGQQLPVGFLLSCPPLGRTSAGVFVAASCGGGGGGGAAGQPSLLGHSGAGPGCQALLALVPANGIAMLAMANTVDAGGHADAPTSCCSQVGFAEAVKSVEQVAATSCHAFQVVSVESFESVE